MKRRLQIFWVLMCLSLPIVTIAQDSRFSQYFNNPVYLNPALAGNGIEYIRVTAIYRNQWAGLGTPFTTQGLSVDKVVGRVGIGATIVKNGAGNSGISTMGVAGNLAYHLPFGPKKINTLSGGIQVGIVSKSFDESKLSFDNQYSPDGGYDPTLSSGELFTTTSVTRPDVNIGLLWQRGWKEKHVRFKPFAGISISHVTRPDETFISDNNKAAIKQSLYAGMGYQITERTEIRPSVMILRQDQFKENTLGALVNYSLDNKNAVQAGVYNRLNDAVIAYAGYQMNQLAVGMSYDITTSDLSSTGKSNNAFELSLTYSPRPKRARIPKEVLKKKEEETKQEEAQQTTNTKQDEVAVTIDSTTVSHETTPLVPDSTIANNNVNAASDFDGDGVPDSIDECPYIKGGIASKGCPDSDNDGIIDMIDKCPMEAGTAANHGCPDVHAPVAQSSQVMIKKFDNILFEPGKSKLNTDDIFDIIERAIDIMYADKSTTVILSGNTDSEGDALQNMHLSQARADMVKAYMIKQGIDESRIQTIAYGETMPLSDNSNEEGKKENRRVEINIIRKK